MKSRKLSDLFSKIYEKSLNLSADKISFDKVFSSPKSIWKQ